MKPCVGFIGYRGIVGYTLISRLIKKGDYGNYNFIYFGSTKIPNCNVLPDDNYKTMTKCEAIICCKDSDYSFNCFKNLKLLNWLGYWLDASSCFRRCNKSIIVLDPLNRGFINKELERKKIYCGGNCTVSIMLISILKILKTNMISSINCTSFQSLSGAGFSYLSNVVNCTGSTLLKLGGYNTNKILEGSVLKEPYFLPLNPWIGNKVGSLSEEELKGSEETNIILKSSNISKIDVFSTCVRVSAIRCHSLSLTITLNKNISLDSFILLIRSNKYIRYVNNNSYDTLKKLNPNYVSGKEKIYVGRVRKISNCIYSIFVVGDQLIWGASEPIRRALSIIYNNVFKNKN
ncbi:aspartate-semialdehyde dehydrogenase [Candidatus Vidania fulgoroideae]|uniref:Aspartate-semialdehyde dehydrogenase n=1 Tax=Candidatus Vidania fulgoroideorum TaxID=881286 RepID=A0A974X7I6_9PROT|nr:aspartate-semialdehyde dehydrogenase [Candidatus Vidania fulgoroideae]